MRTAAFVALWALAGSVVVMHACLQYTNPAIGRGIEALPSRTMPPRGTAAEIISEQEVRKQNTQSRTGGPGVYNVLGGAVAMAICFGLGVQPAAASNVGMIPLLKGGTLPQTVGQKNNINNGVGGSLQRANVSVSSATPANLLQLLVPLAGIIGSLAGNKPLMSVCACYWAIEAWVCSGAAPSRTLKYQIS